MISFRTPATLGLFVVALFLLVGCGETESPQAPEIRKAQPRQPAAASISDGANGGNDHFYFLPPLVPDPSYGGTFLGDLSPVVEICLLVGGECSSGDPIAQFATSSGGSSSIRVDSMEEHYIVNWSTRNPTFVAAGGYRIRVLVGGLELGHVDVNVDSNGRVTVHNESVSQGGHTVPIKFRIEEGAVNLATLVLGPDVSQLMKSELKELRSIIAAVPIADEMQIALPSRVASSLTQAGEVDPIMSLVVAVNDKGDPVLTAFARDDQTTELSARSTALAAAKIVVMAFFEIQDEGQADDLIASHASFPELIAGISSYAEQGSSYVGDETILVLAASIGTDTIRDLPLPSGAPAGLRGAATSPIDLSPLPLLIHDWFSTRYRIQNDSRMHWYGESVEDDTGTPIDAQIVGPETCFLIIFCSPGFTDLEGRNEKVRVTLSQNFTTRLEHIEIAVADAFSLVLQTANLDDVIDRPTLVAILNTVKAVLDLDEIVSTTQRDGAAAGFQKLADKLVERKNDIIEAIVDIVGPRLAEGILKSGLESVVGVGLPALTAVELGVFAAEKVPFYYEWATFNSASRTETICQTDDVFSDCPGQVDYRVAWSASESSSATWLEENPGIYTQVVSRTDEGSWFGNADLLDGVVTSFSLAGTLTWQTTRFTEYQCPGNPTTTEVRKTTWTIIEPDEFRDKLVVQEFTDSSGRPAVFDPFTKQGFSSPPASFEQRRTATGEHCSGPVNADDTVTGESVWPGIWCCPGDIPAEDPAGTRFTLESAKTFYPDPFNSAPFDITWNVSIVKDP